MNNIIQPLRKEFKLDEDAGFVADQIIERVRSEDNYTSALGYPLIRTEDIEGRLGKPCKECLSKQK